MKKSNTRRMSIEKMKERLKNPVVQVYDSLLSDFDTARELCEVLGISPPMMSMDLSRGYVPAVRALQLSELLGNKIPWYELVSENEKLRHQRFIKQLEKLGISYK